VIGETLDDIDRIMAVMEAAFDPAYGEAWNRRQVSDALLLPNTHYLLAAADGGEPREGEAAAGFVRDAVLPLSEYNRPSPNSLRTTSGPVIYEAAFRRGASGARAASTT